MSITKAELKERLSFVNSQWRLSEERRISAETQARELAEVLEPFAKMGELLNRYEKFKGSPIKSTLEAMPVKSFQRAARALAAYRASQEDGA